NQFQRRKTYLDSISEKWKEIYKPLERIKEESYVEIISEISIEE
ncbi:34201_t:CDS:1, partial [Gigaspora margarita]